MDTVTRVKKTTENYLFIKIYSRRFDYKKGEWITGNHDIRRRPHQVLVIDKQLRYNKRTYPEHLV